MNYIERILSIIPFIFLLFYFTALSLKGLILFIPVLALFTVMLITQYHLFLNEENISYEITIFSQRLLKREVVTSEICEMKIKRLGRLMTTVIVKTKSGSMYRLNCRTQSYDDLATYSAENNIHLIKTIDTRWPMIALLFLLIGFDNNGIFDQTKIEQLEIVDKYSVETVITKSSNSTTQIPARDRFVFRIRNQEVEMVVYDRNMQQSNKGDKVWVEYRLPLNPLRKSYNLYLGYN